MTASARAVVFANGEVGERCLAVLLAGGVKVPLVVTYHTEQSEVAFGDLEKMALEGGLHVAFPDDPRDPALRREIERLAPNFIFSFYYRQLLPDAILELATRGALNMHGSLLPKYRGRVPVNWAVIRGETETGATLHYMTSRADAGDIVDQQWVPILPDDTAFQVFRKVTVAAEIVLARTLPDLVAGSAPRIPQNAAAVTVFGKRRPEDGEIDWSARAKAVHDLIRGVAPPYPGAYTMIDGRRLTIFRTRREPARTASGSGPTMYFEEGACYLRCADGGVLRMLACALDGDAMAPADLERVLGAPSIALPSALSQQRVGTFSRQAAP